MRSTDGLSAACASTASGAAAVTASPAPAPMARRKSRRPNLLLSSCFIAGPPDPSILVRASRRQCECFGFERDQGAPEQPDAAIEIGGLGALDVAEEAADPVRHVVLEDDAVGAFRRRQRAGAEPGHDLAQDAGVIFGLGNIVGARDTDLRVVLAQTRQRPLMQEAGEIIRAVRHDLAAADADEQREELALDSVGA